MTQYEFIKSDKEIGRKIEIIANAIKKASNKDAVVLKLLDNVSTLEQVILELKNEIAEQN